MKKNFLTDDIRRLVITPENWRVILPGKIPDIPKNKENIPMPPFQYHKHREIMLALSGTCIYGFDREYHECTPGTLFLIDHNVKHEYPNFSGSEQLLHLWTYVLKGPQRRRPLHQDQQR